MGTGGVFLRKLRARVSDRPTGFVWVEKGKLAGSGYLASRSQVEWIVNHGFDVILTLTENPLPAESLKELAVTVEYIPMRDHQAPSLASLDKAADYVGGQLKDGKTVLVHCLAGAGRTGCVLAAYLIKHRGVNAEEAIRTLREIKPAFVEWSQEKAVLEYGKTAKP